ncbi:MAG: pilin [Firmicutes bacterium]|nr:pilin [Bacillota bacterium]
MNTLLAGFIALLGTSTTTTTGGANEGWGPFLWLKHITDAIDVVLYPILALVATAGIIYAIVLGVNLAKAESTEKRDEAKKRMINAIIGFVSIIALVLIMKLVINFMPEILKLFNAVPTTTT